MKTIPAHEGPAAPSRSFRAKVVDNRRIKGEHYLLAFSPLSGAIPPRPGQFYMISTGSRKDPLLKRPFCYFEGRGEDVGILYRVRGRGTRLLTDLKPGDELEAVGPLGNSYPLPPRKARPLVIAGGTAVASVFPLIRALKGRAIVVYGARTADELVMVEELRSMASELHICTDDGTCEREGNVLDVVRDMGPGEDHVLYICGPRPMTMAMAGFAGERGLRGYVSLEEFMACGIGACMGCVVNTARGYKRVCREGPVFRLDEVVL